MKQMFFRIKRSIRYVYLRLLRIRASSRSIALGLAVGVFAGCLPFLSMQMALAVSLAFVFGGNPVAAALGSWWSNPLNWGIIFPLFYLVGKMFFPGEDTGVLNLDTLIRLSMADLFTQGGRWLLTTTVGGIIAGVPLALGAYYCTLRAVQAHRSASVKRRMELKFGAMRNE